MTNHICGTDRNDRTASSGREDSWAAAFTSGDPGRRWAAACSVARCVAAADPWTDSTALHEAACGAFDAVTDRSGLNPVPAALFGARRALHWERQARFRLIPPAEVGQHRWRAQTSAPDDRGVFLMPLAAVDHGLAAPEPTDGVLAGPRHSGIAEIAGRALRRAGWRWAVPAADAVDAAIDAVLHAGRDRAAAALAGAYPELAGPAAEGMVLLVAGSRRRDRRVWPGIVWLRAHLGTATAMDDPGTRAVIAAVAAGRRARPASIAGAALHRGPALPFRPRRTGPSSPWPTRGGAPRRVLAAAS